MTHKNISRGIRLPTMEIRLSDLKLWIQRFDNKNIVVDINRVTHLATHTGHIELIDYLVQTKGAKLEEKDNSGRSAIFYAAKSDSPETLKYVTRNFDGQALREQMNHKDADHWTPLHYAAMSSSLANVEICLDAGARPDGATLDALSTTASSPDYMSSTARPQIQLLLTMYSELKSYRDLPLYVEGSHTVNRYPALFTINQMQTEMDLMAPKGRPRSERGFGVNSTWIHVPWTNVS
jgi:hypothetical protein